MRSALWAAAALAVSGTAWIAGTGSASAGWSASGSGGAAGSAMVMPTGTAPAASVSGLSVSLRWGAATLSNGTAVEGYVVKRYDATTGAVQTVGAGCSGVITTANCTEQNVPAGRWTYTDTPAQYPWNGKESQSTSVTV